MVCLKTSEQNIKTEESQKKKNKKIEEFIFEFTKIKYISLSEMTAHDNYC